MIRVSGLTATAAGRAIVAGVSFTVAAGEVLALVGESGSGKTTIGLALLGETRPGVVLTGTVTVDGRAGYVQQHPAAALNPARRAGSVLRDIGPYSEALATAQLPADRAFLRRYPHQYSGGQQQRLVLAGALASGARVLVLDEPTTGLDPASRDAVLRELKGLAGQGYAIVLLSHDLAAVRAVADRVLVLRGGVCAEQGLVGEVFGAPRSGYTKKLLAPRPRLHRPHRQGGALTIRGLSAAHGRRTVLRDVHLTAGPGECVGIAGPSGSGKTTLGRCVAGLHQPSAGSITVDGRVQYVFQDPFGSFDPTRTVARQVSRTAVRLRGLSRAAALAEASDLLTTLGVPDGYPRQLSGGELQRAAIARAVLAEPAVLVCDEVTSALDTVTTEALLELLTGIQATLLFISHDTDLLTRIADRVATVENGTLTLSGD
ncbi:ABC transporter ATP-binding protein [Longispora albida]|uniref:ABC transporter ATP-binding protein n=1 Tax=Longispora albida TaxID=203523 RepID=UPI0003690C68|nr:ATP-binding cassette domain-containing protein [Longispora albida]